MKIQKLFRELATLQEAMQNAIVANNLEWAGKHHDKIEYLVKQYLPSGSGFDNGTKIKLVDKVLQKLVFTIAFHHMNENGYYDGWTEHEVTAKASLAHGFTLSVSGRNRNDIKNYICEVFEIALNDVEWSLREEYLRQVESHSELKITSTWKDQCIQEWHCMGNSFTSFQQAVRFALKQLFPNEIDSV